MHSGFNDDDVLDINSLTVSAEFRIEHPGCTVKASRMQCQSIQDALAKLPGCTDNDVLGINLLTASAESRMQHSDALIIMFEALID